MYFVEKENQIQNFNPFLTLETSKNGDIREMKSFSYLNYSILTSVSNFLPSLEKGRQLKGKRNKMKRKEKKIPK